MHWIQYDIIIVGKVRKNTFVVPVKVNCLAYVETTTPKYTVFYIFIRKTYTVTTLATDSQITWPLLNYF
jgi:hypothetical protein